MEFKDDTDAESMLERILEITSFFDDFRGKCSGTGKTMLKGDEESREQTSQSLAPTWKRDNSPSRMCVIRSTCFQPTQCLVASSSSSQHVLFFMV